MQARHRRAARWTEARIQYTCIVKVWDPDARAIRVGDRWQNPGRWLKFRKVFNLLQLRAHLQDRYRFPTAWMFCNVYLKSRGHVLDREQLGAFTCQGRLPPARPDRSF